MQPSRSKSTSREAGRLGRAVDHLHPGLADGRVVGVVVIFAGTQSTHALSANAGDALFLARFGVEFLPVMYVVLGMATMGVLLCYTAALSILSRRALYTGLLGLGAVCMVLLRVMVEVGERWVFAVIWLVANLLTLATLALMWNLAGDVADARSAKRLFPVFAAAGLAGGVAGNLATGPVAGMIGTPNLLLINGLILGCIAAVAGRVAVDLRSVRSSGSAMRRTIAELGHATRSPLLRLVAIALVLATALFYVVAFSFNEQVSASFDDEIEIAGFLGLFAAAAVAVTFLVSILVANRMFARFGVLVAWLMVAVVYLVGFSLWLATLTLVTASIFRFAQWVMTASVGETARSAVFNVLGADRRGEVMAAFAAVPTQLGVVSAGGLLLVTRGLDDRTGSAIGLVLAAFLALAVWRMRRYYSQSLIEALREGDVEVFTAAHSGFASMTDDANAITTLIAGTRNERPDMRRLSVETLGRIEATEGVAAAASLLDDDDVDVRVAALEALGHLAASVPDVTQPSRDEVLGAVSPDGTLESMSSPLRAGAAEWLARVGDTSAAAAEIGTLLGSSEPSDRRRGLDLVSRLRWAPDPEAVLDLLAADVSGAVRAAAAYPVAVLFGPRIELCRGFMDNDPLVRIATGEAWRDVGGDPESILELLETTPSVVWEAATIALGDNVAPIRDQFLAWATPHVIDLVDLTRQHATVTTLSGDSAAPAGAYLAFLFEERMQAARRTAMRILAGLEPDETATVLIDGIASSDPVIKAQALEAAEAIGGRLGRQVVPILESPPFDIGPVRDLMIELVVDDDPWIRVLALRCIGELTAKEWTSVVEPATHDPDERVRLTAAAVMARMEPVMARTLDTVGRLDRMLLLRAVPIFESLLPDDLERLAESAVEHTYRDGETIFTVGDVTQELLLVVEGAVELGREGQAVAEHLERGSFLGELAALCGLPRATDAIARGQTRILAVAVTTLDRLLDDRPEVARQMLSILAKRLADTRDRSAFVPAPPSAAIDP